MRPLAATGRMRPVSDRFLASLRESHRIDSRCQLLFPGEPTPVDVDVIAGEITIDATAQSRRRGSIEIPWSLAAGIELGLDLRSLPLGGYARIEKGLRYPDGSFERVLLGQLRVESVSWETLAQAATLELADRMAQVHDEPFTAPFAAGGMRPADAAIAIVAAGLRPPTSATPSPTTRDITMGDVFFTGARSEALTALEQAASAQTYFDAEGDFVFASKEPGEPVWSVDAGAPGRDGGRR